MERIKAIRICMQHLLTDHLSNMRTARLKIRTCQIQCFGNVLHEPSGYIKLNKFNELVLTNACCDASSVVCCIFNNIAASYLDMGGLNPPSESRTGTYLGMCQDFRSQKSATDPN